MPEFRQYAVAVPKPGVVVAENTRPLGQFLRDIMMLNRNQRNFRVFGPDETASNRLDALFEATDRAWMAERRSDDDHLSAEGRVMEILSEHTCQGWLEGYLLTGRHGFFSSYEAFIHIVDSMFNQHAKWLKVTRHIPWRAPIASLNYLLTSHVWRQDHNGFSHQDPGFIDHVVNKKAEVIRVYLPPDANTLSVADHRLQAGAIMDRRRQAAGPSVPRHGCGGGTPRRRHRNLGWASTDQGLSLMWSWPVPAMPTLETLAAAALLREHLPEVRVRVVNVVDLMRLQPREEHPRPVDRRVRRALHHQSADHLRVPWVSLADPPADLPADEPRRPSCAGIQRGGHDHDAL
jgi:xylulose-5-phosphate/fructose-6-phosphate phosphoketolase